MASRSSSVGFPGLLQLTDEELDLRGLVFDLVQEDLTFPRSGTESSAKMVNYAGTSGAMLRNLSNKIRTEVVAAFSVQV